MDKMIKTASSVEIGLIQINAEKFGCRIVELSVVADDLVRATIVGNKNDIVKLFEFVEEIK